MKNTVSDNKISDFRDLVNSHSSFVYKVYRNKDGKNYWNIICSCMDWISVSIRYLRNAPELSSDIDVRVMQMFSLISSIDIVSESITQLHRVFINKKSLPFDGEKECFSQRLFDEDDNSYFKTIRASFGAHPVNLNQSNSKRFASWPFNSFTNSGELMVCLYSNQVDEEDLMMSLNVDELFVFLIKRYNYLDVISKAISSHYDDFKYELINHSIGYITDPLEQLYVLRDESVKRLDNEYYNNLINDLIRIFESKQLEPELDIMVSDYKQSLISLIDEIRVNLQTMNIIDLENEHILNPQSDIRKVLNYEIGKFYSWIYGNNDDPLLSYYLERFNELTDFRFNFSTNDSTNSLFVKLKLMLIYSDFES